MSQSPWCSPVGKRLRAMEDSDSDSDEADEFKAGDAEAYMFMRSFNEDNAKLMLNKTATTSDDLGEDGEISDVNMNPDEEDEDETGEADDDGGHDVDSDNEEELEDEPNMWENRIIPFVIDDDMASRSSLSSGWGHIHARLSDDEDDSDLMGGYGSSADDDEIDRCLPEEYLKHDPTPDTQYPKPDWITLKELNQRKCGFTSTRNRSRCSNIYWFERYVNNSLWMIQRLQRKATLEEHTGCVNCNEFNSTGQLLCSGSDDLSVCIWDWQLGKLKKKITAGHTNNIFHSQFCDSDGKIITSSRDGTVRLIDIESGLSELLASQSGEIGRLAFITPQTLVTCGTNACVNHIDLRDRSSFKLFIVRNPKDNRTCALHSINTHPIDNHKVVVAGASPYVFLYDLRRVVQNLNDYEHKPTYCLDRFDNTDNIVTSTAFNSTGDKLLISFNDDDLVLCRTSTCEVVHTYTGHRNKKTIKGCAWFGDNYVLSGSDDGHIYGWDVESEHIVCFLRGDDKGAVNSLSIHPTLPILASSGREHNIKIWEPTSNTWPQTLKGIKPQICKNNMRRKRAKERRRDYSRRFFLHGDESDTDW